MKPINGYFLAAAVFSLISVGSALTLGGIRLKDHIHETGQNTEFRIVLRQWLESQGVQMRLSGDGPLVSTGARPTQRKSVPMAPSPADGGIEIKDESAGKDAEP